MENKENMGLLFFVKEEKTFILIRMMEMKFMVMRIGEKIFN